MPITNGLAPATVVEIVGEHHLSSAMSERSCPREGGAHGRHHFVMSRGIEESRAQLGDVPRDFPVVRHRDEQERNTLLDPEEPGDVEAVPPAMRTESRARRAHSPPSGVGVVRHHDVVSCPRQPATRATSATRSSSTARTASVRRHVAPPRRAMPKPPRERDPHHRNVRRSRSPRPARRHLESRHAGPSPAARHCRPAVLAAHFYRSQYWVPGITIGLPILFVRAPWAAWCCRRRSPQGSQWLRTAAVLIALPVDGQP
jgi:hypothetical protein